MIRLMALLALFVAGARIPGNVKPVGNFDAGRYLEVVRIARLDHGFGAAFPACRRITASGMTAAVRVLNRGYSAAEGKWKEARASLFRRA